MREARRPWLDLATRRHLRSWRFRAWAAILAVVGGILCFVPLLGTLGFGFAFVMALVASIAATDLGCALVRVARSGDAHPFDHSRSAGPVVAELCARASLAALATLVVPVILVSLNAFRVRNCDLGFGLRALFAMPVLSVVYGSAVGVGLGLLAGSRRRLSLALPYLFVALAIIASGWSFYGAPPVFFYNPMVGFFPGNLYDESIELGNTFAWARLFHFAALGAVLALVTTTLDVPTLSLRRRRRRPAGRRRLEALAALLTGAMAALLWWQSAALGFAVSAHDVQSALGGHRRTEHFDIYYPIGSPIAEDIDRIAEDHEFRYAQVTRDLGAVPSERIRSYYFESSEDKHRWMGARRVHMAKPWRREIYVSDQEFPHEVIRHEIAHAVAASFGAPVFRVSADTIVGLPLAFNPGMIEGLAVAADWPNHFRQSLTPHESVKAMVELGVAPPLDRVLSSQFFAYSGARSYTTAGSFLRYLLDTYGQQPVQELYRSGGDFEAVFGRSQESLVIEWKAMLAAMELPANAAEIAREPFRRKSMFERPCPHYIARAGSEAAALSARGEHAEAIRLWRSVCDRVPDEPQYWLELAELYRRAKEPERARPVLERIASDAEAVTSTLRAKALRELAILDVRDGHPEAARKRLENADALPLPDDEARNVRAMRWVLDHQGPAQGPLRRYFFAAEDVPAQQARLVVVGWIGQALALEHGDALAHYLLGRNLHGRGVPTTVVESLERALDLGLPDPLLTREAARLLASAAYLAGRDREAARAAGLLLHKGEPTVLRLYGLDWLERLHWRRTGEVPSPRLRLEDWETRVGGEFPDAVSAARGAHAAHEPPIEPATVPDATVPDAPAPEPPINAAPPTRAAPLGPSDVPTANQPLR